MSEHAKETLSMTADSVGIDLLQALVQEIKLLPDLWIKLSKAKQDDVIDRLRNRVEYGVKMAVHLIASEGRTVVQGDIDQITIKDGVKAVIKFSSSAPNLHGLFEASGNAVLVVVANPAQHTGGMDQVRGESDQRAMDLGKEYKPDSDGEDMDDATDTPLSIERQPTTEELEQAYRAGQKAAQDDLPQSECPVMDGRLCISWIKGWKDWHEENPLAEGGETDEE